MDMRRLSTLDVLRSGILELPAPQTDIPDGREEISCSNWETPEADVLIMGLEAGKLLSGNEYYGCVSAWKVSDGVYRALLMQYCSVTEDETFNSAASCVEWFCSTLSTVSG